MSVVNLSSLKMLARYIISKLKMISTIIAVVPMKVLLSRFITGNAIGKVEYFRLHAIE